MPAPLIITESERKAASLRQHWPGPVDTVTVTSTPCKVSYQQASFSVTPLPAEQPLFEALTKAIDRDIYLALDHDEKGEYWAWLIAQFFFSFSQRSPQPKRIQLLGINGQDLALSLKLLEPVTESRALAYYCRHLFNACLSKHLQRLLGTRTGPGDLALDYGALTILFLLADRETQLTHHARSPKWKIKTAFTTPAGELSATLTWAAGRSGDGWLKDAAESKQVLSLLGDASFRVASVKAADLSLSPPPPYSLSELLAEASIALDLPVERSFAIIRKLYEGVEVAGKIRGLISSYLPVNNKLLGPLFTRLRAHITERHGAETLGTEPSAAREGHYMLPLSPELTEQDLHAALNQEETTIYSLIRTRALGSQMREATGKMLALEIEAGADFSFEAQAQVLTDRGYLGLIPDQEPEWLDASALSVLQNGLALEASQIAPEPHADLPEYHTLESLFSELADFAMLPDSSTISLLQRITDAGYVSLLPDGTLRCQERALKVVGALNKAFPKMSGINLSAYFEQTVAEAVSGRKPLDVALRQFDQTLFMQGQVLVTVGPAAAQTLARRATTSRHVIKGATTVEPVRPPPPPPVRPAVRPEEVAAIPEAELSPPPAADTGTADALEPPDTEKSEIEAAPPQVELLPQNALEEIPTGEPELVTGALETAEAADETAAELTAAPAEVTALPTPEDTGEVALADTPAEIADKTPPAEQKDGARAGDILLCPECGKPLVIRDDAFGRFWRCSAFPKCRHTRSFKGEDLPDAPCPVCKKGAITTKKTPAGRPYFVCSQKECEFIAWSQPYPIPCPECGSPYLVEKKTADGGHILRCPRAGCPYRLRPEGGAQGSAAESKTVRRVVRRPAKTRKVLVRKAK